MSEDYQVPSSSRTDPSFLNTPQSQVRPTYSSSPPPINIRVTRGQYDESEERRQRERIPQSLLFQRLNFDERDCPDNLSQDSIAQGQFTRFRPDVSSVDDPVHVELEKKIFQSKLKELRELGNEIQQDTEWMFLAPRHQSLFFSGRPF
eukprot:TRINITY_DN2184_c0_g1_i11.p2 TRINITY_DN2184_c0_g1~~TRINITY_DN2184_c0_g1_i11.p2  ORF type:complete len:170 (+),score=11.85 TRINITY_DN2184_c0_g1_i11:68-511(+)